MDREMKKSLNSFLFSCLTLWLNLLAVLEMAEGSLVNKATVSPKGTFLSPHSRYLAANGAIMRTSVLGILNFNGELC